MDIISAITHKLVVQSYRKGFPMEKNSTPKFLCSVMTRFLLQSLAALHWLCSAHHEVFFKLTNTPSILKKKKFRFLSIIYLAGNAWIKIASVILLCLLAYLFYDRSKIRFSAKGDSDHILTVMIIHKVAKLSLQGNNDSPSIYFHSILYFTPLYL